MSDLDKVAREYYLTKPNPKLQNKLAKLCLPFLESKVKYVCKGSNWDRADLYSFLNMKLIYLMENYSPNELTFDAILCHHLDNMAKNWIVSNTRRAHNKPLHFNDDPDRHLESKEDFVREQETREFVNRLLKELKHPTQILVLKEMVSSGVTSTTILGRRLNLSSTSINYQLKKIKEVADTLH